LRADGAIRNLADKAANCMTSGPLPRVNFSQYAFRVGSHGSSLNFDNSAEIASIWQEIDT
jgi:hypothetical protein